MGIFADRSQERSARMAELVDASVSNTDVARRAGSTPAPGTNNKAALGAALSFTRHIRSGISPLKIPNFHSTSSKFKNLERKGGINYYFHASYST